MAATTGLRSRWRVGIGVAVALGALVFASPSLAAMFQVNNTADATTPTPDCNVLGQSGTCTLRDAIAKANVSGPNTIVFAIAGSGTHSISLTSPLPQLVGSVTIDGFSQGGPGYT